MNSSQALHAYRTFDPSGWVSVYRLLPVWAGLVLAALGLVLLLFGGGRFFRLVAGPLGLVVGALWGAAVLPRLGLPLPESKVLPAVALGMAVLGFAFPPAIVFLAVGLPLGFFAGQLAGDSEFALGFAPAFLLSGAVAAVFHRPIASVVSAVAGAWALVLGLLAALHSAGSLSQTVASYPAAVLATAVLLATGGAFYQLAVRPSPEQAEQRAVEQARTRKREQEKRALEERWANYSPERGDDP